MSGDAPVVVKVRRLAGAGDLPLPEQATSLAAGFDLRACLDGPRTIVPGERVAIPTGLAVAIPAGHEAQVRPRSGLAIKQGLGMVNAPGTIDADYRGEIRVILINHGQEPVVLRRGDRIAQLVVQRLPEVAFEECAELPPTERGDGGFGHTGER